MAQFFDWGCNLALLLKNHEYVLSLDICSQLRLADNKKNTGSSRKPVQQKKAPQNVSKGMTI